MGSHKLFLWHLIKILIIKNCLVSVVRAFVVCLNIVLKLERNEIFILSPALGERTSTYLLDHLKLKKKNDSHIENFYTTYRMLLLPFTLFIHLNV